MALNDHSSQSSQREKVLEHLFVGELLRCLWKRGLRDVEVLRSEVDRGGYDIVVECGGILRHIQLKASYAGAKTRDVKVNTNLALKPSGCVIWINFDPDTLELGPFLWFGAAPGAPLPPLGERVARHTKGDKTGFKSARPGLRLVAQREFRRLESIEAVAAALFNPIRIELPEVPQGPLSA